MNYISKRIKVLVLVFFIVLFNLFGIYNVYGEFSTNFGGISSQGTSGSYGGSFTSYNTKFIAVGVRVSLVSSDSGERINNTIIGMMVIHLTIRILH